MLNLTQQLLEENTLAALLLERPDLFENLASRLPHLLREFPNLDDEQIEAAYAADPSKGKYTRWICLMVVNGILRFPEDAEKTHQRLTQFKELSRKNDWKGEKDINKYKSYGDLAKAIETNSGVETKGEIKRRRAVEGAELVWEEGEKQIYKVTTVEGGLALGWRNTEWCVKDPKYFDDYGPPFYCLLVSGRPHILLHLEGGQIMDEYDNPTGGWEDFIEAGIIDVQNDPQWAFNYAREFIGGRWPEGEPVIMKDPKWAYEYARNIIKGQWLEAEPYIMKDSFWAFNYANIIKGRWPEAEPTIMKDPECAYYYALDVIGGRWPEAEPIIMRDPEWAYSYALDVIGGRWPEAEPYIMKDPKWVFHYANDIIKSRWPEAEPSIMKDPDWAYSYAYNVIGGRWPEAEPYIMRDPKWAYHYTNRIIKKSWPEAEPYIMKDPLWAFRYAAEVLGGRWPEAEPYIEKDHVQSRQYHQFLDSLEDA